MFNRMFRLGLAVFASETIWVAGTASAQVPDDPNAPTPPGVPAKKPERATSGLPGSAKRQMKPQKIEEGDVWKKNPPIWSVNDPSPYTHPYATEIYIAPGVGTYPGGPAGRFGYPYYYTNNTQFNGGGIYPGAAAGPPLAGGAAFGQGNYAAGPSAVPPSVVGSGIPGGGFVGGVPSSMGIGAMGPSPIGSGPMGPYPMAAYPMGAYPAGPNVAGPGLTGFPGVGLGYPQTAAMPGMLPGNPYLYHFGPGFYRFQEAGHYRFPYYSYRRPWYFPGHPSYNRDTNIPW